MERIYFSLDEANALIPFLTERIQRLQFCKSQLDDVIIANEGIDVEALFRDEPKEPALIQLRQRLQTLGDEINDILFDIQEKGAVVKDLDQGLVDFFCKLKDRTVYLCWKFGESEIGFWHGVDEGFAERKSLLEREYLECVTKLH